RGYPDVLVRLVSAALDGGEAVGEGWGGGDDPPPGRADAGCRARPVPQGRQDPGADPQTRGPRGAGEYRHASGQHGGITPPHHSGGAASRRVAVCHRRSQVPRVAVTSVSSVIPC